MNVRIFWVRAMKCMYAQTRPRFILSSEGVLGGMEVEPMLTPREKSPLPIPRGWSNPRRCGQRAQALPTELFRPPISLLHHIQFKINKTMLQFISSQSTLKCTQILFMLNWMFQHDCLDTYCFWVSYMHVFSVFVFAPVQRNWACFTWKSALEIRSLLLLLLNPNIVKGLTLSWRSRFSCVSFLLSSILKEKSN